MNSKNHNITICISGLALLIIILDTKTATEGAYDGIRLCIQSIIPTLFPFCFLTRYISGQLNGIRTSFLRPIGRLCKLPIGAELILFLGFLGGYPVGAQCIADAYQNGVITQKDARRISSFCNNAGPAFIFGILGPLFQRKLAVWCILLVQIISAVLVGILLPSSETSSNKTINIQQIPVTTALKRSIQSMALICGWIILFRILITYFALWFPAGSNIYRDIIISGILELSNGCIRLQSVDNQGFAFVISSLFLSFGGMCVTMQTFSALRQIGLSQYLIGKLLQSCISFNLAYIFQFLLFRGNQIWHLPAYILLLPFFIFVIIFLKIKIRTRNSVCYDI